MKKGFSLIELLVVITIIGVIAAIGAPVYQNYLIGIRASSVVPIVDDLMNKSIAVAQNKGYFGSCADLGIPAASQSTHFCFVQNPSSFSPYIFNDPQGLEIADITQDFPSAGCTYGRYGNIFGIFDATAVGWNSTIVDNSFSTAFECIFWSYKGVMNKVCMYYYGNFTSGIWQTSNLIPGWYNECGTTNCAGTYGDNPQLNAIMNSTSFLNAECL